MATNRKHDVFNSYQISSLDTDAQPTTEGSQPHAHEGQLALTIKHTVEFSSNRHAPTPTRFQAFTRGNFSTLPGPSHRVYRRGEDDSLLASTRETDR